MVAATSGALGYDFGPMFDGKYDFEDKYLTSGDIDSRLAYIADRNLTHDVWAVKDPMLVSVSDYIPLFFEALRNPVLLIVFRDTLANAQSLVSADEANAQEDFPSLTHRMSQVMDWHYRLFHAICHRTYPTLLIPYERAITHRRKFVEELATFLGCDMSRETKQSAINRISSHGGYLQS